MFRLFKKSLRHATQGIGYIFSHERNFQIELTAAAIASVAAFFFPLSASERAVIFLVIALVLSLEMVNTASERIIDMLKPGLHPYAKIVKDISAGAVLVSALLAIVIGAVVFLPHIAELVVRP